MVTATAATRRSGGRRNQLHAVHAALCTNTCRDRRRCGRWAVVSSVIGSLRKEEAERCPFVFCIQIVSPCFSNEGYYAVSGVIFLYAALLRLPCSSSLELSVVRPGDVCSQLASGFVNSGGGTCILRTGILCPVVCVCCTS